MIRKISKDKKMVFLYGFWTAGIVMLILQVIFLLDIKSDHRELMIKHKIAHYDTLTGEFIMNPVVISK